MFSVPNVCACMEIKTTIRIMNFTRFFKYTAIMLNTAVYHAVMMMDTEDFCADIGVNISDFNPVSWLYSR